jgi:predicted peroxiredoxin
MKHKLAILIWGAGPDRPQLCATPFVHAAAGASFDCEVEIHFAGPAVRLLVEGVAADLRPWPDMSASVYDMMRQAANLDAKLIPEYSGTAGASAFVQRALDPEWATLVY